MLMTVREGIATPRIAPLEQALEKCRQRGHAVKQEDGSWRLTPEGFLISNSIISDLQIIQDEAPPLAKRR